MRVETLDRSRSFFLFHPIRPISRLQLARLHLLSANGHVQAIAVKELRERLSCERRGEILLDALVLRRVLEENRQLFVHCNWEYAEWLVAHFLVERRIYE